MASTLAARLPDLRSRSRSRSSCLDLDLDLRSTDQNRLDLDLDLRSTDQKTTASKLILILILI